uniref:Uncharacterized protein n=1 Tax=Arundo donax TaxID=35708 RepID=A0A0A9BG03_ARUDO
MESNVIIQTMMIWLEISKVKTQLTRPLMEALSRVRV